jgi:hypothetical protein
VCFGVCVDVPGSARLEVLELGEWVADEGGGVGYEGVGHAVTGGGDVGIGQAFLVVGHDL